MLNIKINAINGLRNQGLIFIDSLSNSFAISGGVRMEKILSFVEQSLMAFRALADFLFYNKQIRGFSGNLEEGYIPDFCISSEATKVSRVRFPAPLTSGMLLHVLLAWDMVSTAWR